MLRPWVNDFVLLLAGCAAGCAAAPGRADHALGSAGGSASRSLTSGGSIAPIAPIAPPTVIDLAGPRQTLPVIVVLSVYRITAPYGAISRNDAFWKHVDEDAVDIGTHDLLLKNGLRIGIGRDADWLWFKGLLGKYPSAFQTTIRAQPGHEGYFDLPMKSGVREQTIFGIDDHGHDWGRRFEQCKDLLGISFIASPHNPGMTIVKVCPKVVGLRKFFHVSILNNEETRVEPDFAEQLYDMRLEALVGLNDFLIVGPSPQASISTSLGATFLLENGKAEPLENVLIIVPRAYRIGAAEAR